MPTFLAMFDAISLPQYWVDLLAMIYQVGIIVLQFSAVWLNSAVRFGRLVNKIWPSRFIRMGPG